MKLHEGMKYHNIGILLDTTLWQSSANRKKEWEAGGEEPYSISPKTTDLIFPAETLATLKYLDGKKYVQASDLINLLDTFLFSPQILQARDSLPK